MIWIIKANQRERGDKSEVRETANGRKEELEEAYVESYRVNEALKQQKKMAKEEKDKALKKHLKQKVRKDLKKIDKEEEMYLKIIDSNPKNTDSIFRYCSFLGKAGKYEKGRYILKKALEMEPNNPKIYYNLARSSFDSDEAEKYFLKGL